MDGAGWQPGRELRQASRSSFLLFVVRTGGGAGGGKETEVWRAEGVGVPRLELG